MPESPNNNFYVPKNFQRDLQFMGMPIRNLLEAALISITLTWLISLIPIPSMVLRSTILALVLLASFFALSRGINKDSPTQFLIALAKYLYQRRKLVFRRDFRGK